jgi:hypothetical protein
MIRKGLAVLICAVVLAPALVVAQANAFVGDWLLTIEGGQGTQESSLTIKDAGGKLSAELRGARGTVAISDVKVKGSEAVLKFDVDTPQGVADVVMTLTLKDGVLTVKRDIAGGQINQTGTGKKKG